MSTTEQEQQVASKRTVVANPLIDDPNAGIIVAPGDPLPSGLTGIVSNTPNKVDAAANYDDVDAADKAKAGRPATVVVEGGTGVDPEIAARVAANRSNWFGEADELAQQAANPDANPAENADASDASSGARGDATAPADMTVAELDAAYGDADGYPKSGNKADKVAFAEGQA